MTKFKNAFVVLLALGAFLLPGAVSVPDADASQKSIIRFASLAPPGSAFMKLMKAWNRSLKDGTILLADLEAAIERIFVRTAWWLWSHPGTTRSPYP